MTLETKTSGEWVEELTPYILDKLAHCDKKRGVPTSTIEEWIADYGCGGGQLMTLLVRVALGKTGRVRRWSVTHRGQTQYRYALTD